MDRLQQILGGGQPNSRRASNGLENLRLLAGNSHPILAQKISQILKIPIVESKIDRFSNQEIRTQIMENIRRRNIAIIQTSISRPEINYSVNDFLIEIFIMVNACRLSSVDEITLIIPHFPYARQDKKDVSRAPISGKVMADLLQTVGVTRVVTLDLHASQIGGFFSIPVDNLYAVNIMADYLHQHLKLTESNNQYVLVSPDAGGIKRMDALAQKLKLDNVIMHKSRNHQEKSQVIKTVLIGKENCVLNKTCIIIDDICDTAGTICQAGETLMEHGAKDIIIAVVHGVLSGPAIDRLNERDFIREVIVTNSVPQEENLKRSNKINVIDISPLLAETIRCLYTGDSISELFN